MGRVAVIAERGRWTAAALLLATIATGAAHAELVVLTDGRFIKVESFLAEGAKAFLLLPSGGSLTLPIERVERVVDDEIVPEAERVVTDPGRELLAFRESETVPDTPYGELIFETARRHQVSPTLVAAMVRAESAFDPGAVSSKGARGLMQLMPATARRFGVATERLFDPSANLEAGIRYLDWLRGRFDSLALVLAAYNAGEGSVSRYGGVPPFRETQTYVRRIFGTLGLPLESRGEMPDRDTR